MTMTTDSTILSARGISPARRAMIDSQLRTSGVNQPFVLAAMARLAREDFVPEAARGGAYIDRAIPLGGGRWLAAPLVHARMLGEAAPSLADRALVISGGSSYLAELLRPLVDSLTVIDAAEATGPLGGGPYTLILIDGAAEQLPAGLAGALAEDGRLITGLATRGVTQLAAGRMAAGHIALLPLAEIGMPVLPEFAATGGWSF